MSIKLIATDLDGTLMAPDHLTVTKRTYDALKSSHDKGIRLAVATGRSMVLIDNVISQVPFVDYIIYSNGACVYDKNEEKIIEKHCVVSRVRLYRRRRVAHGERVRFGKDYEVWRRFQ